MIETAEAVSLTAEECGNAATVRIALERAVGLGRRLIIEPPGRDLAITRAVASNGPLYRLGLESVQARGGELRIVESATAPGAGDVHLSRAEASNHRVWLAAQTRAEKQGGVVVVDP